MFPIFSPEPLKWMKLISEDNGKTNEKLYGTKEQNEGEVQRNNRYLESFVATVLSGPKLLMTLKQVLFNHLSLKKSQPDLRFVQTPGKLIPGSLHGDMFIVLLITESDNTLTVKGITSMDLKDSGVI
jgi:hypothetical protein